MSLREWSSAAAAATVVLGALSAYVRHLRSGLGCQPWPSCYGEAVFTIPAGLRPAHRMLALLVLVLVAWLLVRAWRTRDGRAAATLAAGAVAGLALIGPLSGDAARDAVTLANLLGGWALAGALAWLAAPGTPEPGVRRLGLLVAAFAGLAAVNGGTIAAGFSVADCPGLPLCGADAGPAAPLHLAHRAVAVGLALAAGMLAWRLLRAARPGLAAGVAAAAAAQLATGAFLAAAVPTAALATAHGTGAQLLFLLGLAIGRRR